MNLEPLSWLPNFLDIHGVYCLNWSASRVALTESWPHAVQGIPLVNYYSHWDQKAVYRIDEQQILWKEQRCEWDISMHSNWKFIHYLPGSKHFSATEPSVSPVAKNNISHIPVVPIEGDLLLYPDWLKCVIIKELHQAPALLDAMLLSPHLSVLGCGCCWHVHTAMPFVVWGSMMDRYETIIHWMQLGFLWTEIYILIEFPSSILRGEAMDKAPKEKSLKV